MQVRNINEALKELVNDGVLVLPNMDSRTLYFANDPKGYIIDSFDNLVSAGLCKKVADIDCDRFPCTDAQYAVEFDSDGISLVKKA